MFSVADAVLLHPLPYADADRLVLVWGDDARTFVVVPALVGAVALLATWLPARRAGRVDPAVTLRAE